MQYLFKKLNETHSKQFVSPLDVRLIACQVIYKQYQVVEEKDL